jgi:hypothetical protein
MFHTSVTSTSSSYRNVFVNVQHRNGIILDVMAVCVQTIDLMHLETKMLTNVSTLSEI